MLINYNFGPRKAYNNIAHLNLNRINYVQENKSVNKKIRDME